VVAQNPDTGALQTGYHPVGGLIGLEFLDDPATTPEAIAKTATAQALLMLNARKAPAGTMPVVLSCEAGGTMVHEAVGHGLEADLAGEGLSVYHNKIGQKIAGDRINVVDDATLPNKRGSFVFDDEGVPSERTVLIENGVLKRYMSDRKMASKHGFPLTGNGRRESYRYRPICRMTNTMILSGTDDPASILKSTDSGLFVRKMGGGQVNTVNGDFVFEVNEGYLIDKGKIGEPVKGAILMGNGPKVLQIIDKLGNDHGFGIGTCGKGGQGVPVGDAQPTLRIPEIVVGGAS
jgi:TldD protein